MGTPKLDESGQPITSDPAGGTSKVPLGPIDVGVPAAAEKAEIDESVVIPGDAEEITKETADVSPEGRPGDPRVGPNGLRLEVMVGLVLVMFLAVALGWWVNVAAGVVALVIGTLALAVNPVVRATSLRAHEREAVVEHHRREDPDAVVIRTTSKRKERRFGRAE